MLGASRRVILKGTFLGARKLRDAPIDVMQIKYFGACERAQTKSMRVENFTWMKACVVDWDVDDCVASTSLNNLVIFST